MLLQLSWRSERTSIIKINQAVFHTAAACTTGVLGKEFRRLVELVSSIAQEELGGWDPAEIIAGIRGSTAVAIQVGNTVVLEQSWIALAKRDASQLLPSGDARRRSRASIRGSTLAPAPAPAPAPAADLPAAITVYLICPGRSRPDATRTGGTDRL